MRALGFALVVVTVAAGGCRRHPRAAPGGARAVEARAGEAAWRPLAAERTGPPLDEQALATALAATGKSGVARWNRALALRQLGLWRSAAAAFDEVAALGEPGWAAEAKADALALRDQVAARDHAWAKAQSAGRALVSSGAPPPPSVLQHQPTLLRHHLYQALRAAPSVQRVRSLAPLAATLDARDGGEVLQALVTRTAAHDLKARAPLAATYLKLSANPAALDKAAVEKYLAALRAAHEDDLLLGALVLLERNGDELQRLARATNDPWYRAVAAFYDARDLAARDKLVEAEGVVVPALDDCRTHKLDYRCVSLASLLTDVYRRQGRSDEAERAGRAALAEAWEHALPRELELYVRLGEAAGARGAFPLMEALFDEAVRVPPDDCDTRRAVWESAAEAYLAAFQPQAARAALERAPRCGQPIRLARAAVATELVRLGQGGADAATLPADLEAARRTLPHGARAFSFVLDARRVIGRDRAAGHKLLATALGEAGQAPEGDAEARRARALAHLTAAVEDALAGDADAALAALAADVGAKPPARCVLGVAVDGERAIALARGDDGTTSAAVDRARAAPALDAGKLVPAALRGRFGGCSEVAVLAPAPVSGLPELLPPDVAWSYRLRAPPLPSDRTPRSRRVLVAGATPPPSLALPPLPDWRSAAEGERTVVVEGAAATPGRVLAEASEATELEVHAAGLGAGGATDATVLALSPDAAGRFTLSARELARASLRNRPLVLLAACHARRVEGQPESWGLPLAFVRGGAAAVIASPSPIGEPDAAPFFSALLARVRNGVAPARALRDERVRALGTNAGHWSRRLLVFQ